MWQKPYGRLPQKFKNDSGVESYIKLYDKRHYLIMKRMMDVLLSASLIIILSPISAGVALLITVSDPGKIIFKQVRIKRYGEKFTIYKFRTMKENATGEEVTVFNDERITEVGRFLRKYHLDEIPQLLNILIGDMSFVGARPEIPKFVYGYNEQMRATLLLPVGLTSRASIKFKNESKFLKGADTDNIYFKKILPEKMKLNISYINNFSLEEDIKIIFATLLDIFY